MNVESDAKELNKEKKTTIERCLEGDHILVHLDSRNPGVELPPFLMNNQVVTLKLSLYFRGLTAIEDDKIISDLLFSGSYFTCHIPYQSIWGLTTEQGKNIVWPDSAPPELLEELSKTPLEEIGTSPKKDGAKKITKASNKRAHLKRVK